MPLKKSILSILSLPLFFQMYLRKVISSLSWIDFQMPFLGVMVGSTSNFHGFLHIVTNTLEENLSLPFSYMCRLVICAFLTKNLDQFKEEKQYVVFLFSKNIITLWVLNFRIIGFACISTICVFPKNITKRCSRFRILISVIRKDGNSHSKSC